MHAFLQHLDREVATGQAAQRSRAPQLLVVAAARIQAHHQRRLADAPGEVVDIGGQVVAAGFLAGLDQHDAARVRHVLRLQCQDRGQRAEDRVAIVGAAASIQAVALDHRLPWAEVVVPAGHFRLLVEMAVQQHAVIFAAAVERGHLDEDHRRASFQPHHFDLHARDWLRLRPVLHQLDRGVHVAMRDPLGVEHRRLVGDADVLHQLRDDLVVPFRVDEALDERGLHVGGIDLVGVHGDSASGKALILAPMPTKAARSGGFHRRTRSGMPYRPMWCCPGWRWALRR